MNDDTLLLPLRGQHFPIPSRLKRKFESRSQKARPLSLENLESRLQAAEERRESLRQERLSRAARRASSPMHDPQAALERLERRLAAADAKRAAAIHAVRLRAAVTTSRAAAVARSAAHRRHQMARRLEQSMTAAGEARAAHIAGTAARAARAAARAHSTGRAARQREQTEAALRLTTMLHRMKRATASREQALAARKDSAAIATATAMAGLDVTDSLEAFGQEMFQKTVQNGSNSNSIKDHLSVAEAMGLNAGEWLRRQAAARRLQRAWRAFSSGPGTTAALAAAFAATGIPFSVALQGRGGGQEEESASGSEGSSDAEKEDDGCATPPHPLRGPPTPPIAVPLPATAAASGDADVDAGTPPASVGTPAAGMSWSPSPRRQPPARLASSLAEMAAASALGEEAPAPRPASLHHHRTDAPCALSFDEFAEAMSAPGTLRAAQALLRRLAAVAAAVGALAGAADVSGLLRRLFPRLPAGTAPDRYPPRAFLCAYMILAHREVVLSGQGPQEEALTAAAAAMVASFEPLLARVLPVGSPGASKAAPVPLEAALQGFDQAWAFYLEQFVAWKSHDAAGLEAELIRAAVELETSRLAKLAARERGGASDGSLGAGEALRARAVAQDMEALVKGVEHDLKLIGERVRRLTGAQGAARLEAALAAARAAAEGACAAMDPARASPTQSPAKKVPRRGGSYRGGATAAGVNERAGEASPGSPTLLGAVDSTPFDAPAPSEGSDAPVAAAGTAISEDANLALMWHLMYNATWQLPTADADLAWTDALGETDPVGEGASTLDAATDGARLNGSPEAVTASLHSRIRRIAENAFWDGITERLAVEGASGGTTVAAVAGLLAEAGASLAEVLPPGSSVAADVWAQLGDAGRLAEALAPAAGAAGGAATPLPSLNCGALFSLLEWCSALLRRLGAPAREGAAVAAAAAVRRDIAAAVAASDTEATAATAARALRVITVMLRLLRLDAANTHLRALAAQLGAAPAAAAAYATAKLAAGGLGPWEGAAPAEVAARLPQARAWLALASGRLPQIEATLSEAPAASTAPAAAAPAAAAAPRKLQTGRKLTFTSSSALMASGEGAAAPRGLAGRLVAPVAARSWQGLVRAGLAQLVAGEGAVTHLDLPEPLRPDAARLQAAQADFHHLVALTAALLALRTAGGGGGTATSAALDSPEGLECVKRRIRAVLAAPDVCLADLAAAVCAAAGGDGDAAREAAVAAFLRGMLGKSSAALRSITSGLCSALTAHLALGPANAAAGAAAALALARCGAGGLNAEVSALAERLGEVAAVTESVCGPWYETLAADLI